MNFRRNERKLIPLTRETKRDESGTEGACDLLLTPPLYLMKRESLPVRFSFQARKVAPSVMEGLGADPTWVHEVFREGEEWVFVAYDPETVERHIREHGCKPENVKNLYFAQQFVESLDAPLPLDGEEALVNLDGTVAVVPRSLLSEPVGEASPLSSLPRPSPGFPFKGTGSARWLERKELSWIALALVLLGGAWWLEGYRLHRALRTYDQRIETAIGGTPALGSRITRSNIHRKYSAIDHRQRAIRSTLEKIGRLIGKESKISRLTIDRRGYTALIDTSAKRLSSLEKKANALGLPARTEGRLLQIKGRWQ